jgi:hypothetical protein
MHAPQLLLHLLDEGIHLQVVDGRLRAEYPPGTRTLDRAEAIRSEREHLIDLASRHPARILADLRQAGAIVSLESDRIRGEGDRSVMTTEPRALIRFHRAELINALRRDLSDGAMVVGRVWTINDRILEFGLEELTDYRWELVNCREDDPATPEEWAVLARAEQIRAGDADRD